MQRDHEEEVSATRKEAQVCEDAIGSNGGDLRQQHDAPVDADPETKIALDLHQHEQRAATERLPPLVPLLCVYAASNNRE